MNGLSSLLWFIAIVAMIPATLWLLKRTPLGGGGGGGVMRSVASLPLSSSQRVVAVEVGDGDERRWLLLGVTPSSITTLHTMAPQALPQSPLAAAGVHPGAPTLTSFSARRSGAAFAQILGRFQGKRDSAGSDHGR